jgi:hypothetical protein
MTAGRRPGTALVHLVRAANGVAPVAAFLASYERFEAACEHELVLLLKGFGDSPLLDEVRARAAAHGVSEVTVDDDGYDLTAYVKAARCLPHDRLCFVNSFSEVLADGWLGALADPLADPGVGATAATASWASILGYSLWQAGVGGGYDAVFTDRRSTQIAILEANGLACPGRWINWRGNVIEVLRGLRRGALFPAAHLRTNAFCIRGATLRGLGLGRASTKRASYELESGRDSITRRLNAQRLATLVVDRRGRTLPLERWPEASVFWQDEQQDLLVSDNQTRLYDAASPEQRAALRGYAWGLHARPAARADT